MVKKQFIPVEVVVEQFTDAENMILMSVFGTSNDYENGEWFDFD